MSSKKRALITGITGQDGSYLGEFLLGKNYEIFGMTRRSSTEGFGRIEHLLPNITLVQRDLLDLNSLVSALHDAQPHQVYNLASQSLMTPFYPRSPYGAAKYYGYFITLNYRVVS